MHGNQPTARALFDDLQIVPVGTRLDVASEVGLAPHMQAPVPTSPPSPRGSCLSHRSPSLVASWGVRVFSVGSSIRARLLPRFWQWLAQCAADCPSQWSSPARNRLEPLLHNAPFFALVTDLGPQGVQLHTAHGVVG